MRLRYGASLSLLLLLAVAVPARAQNNVTLAQLKSYWGLTTIWNEPCDAVSGICPWAGVVWDAPARVTGITLNNLGLSGAIPSLLGQLSSLQNLNLDNNRITGPFPTELASLDLRVLSLNNNQLSVSWAGVPSIYGSVGTWPNIRTISIVNNSLNSWPVAWFKPSVVTFDASLNPFTFSLPTQIGLMTQLQSLYLEGLSTSTGSFPRTVPTELWAASGTLQTLSLRSSVLSGPLNFPTNSTITYTNLRTLRFANNQLSGPIPDFPAATFPSLNQLELTNNQFLMTSFPVLPPTLSSLFLDGNDLGGATIPPSIFTYPFGQNNTLDSGIDFGFSNLSGPIPEQIGSLSPTYNPASPLGFYVQLDGNRFTGTIPPALLLLPLAQFGDNVWLQDITTLSNCTNPGPCDYLCKSPDGKDGSVLPGCPLWPARPVWNQPYCIAVCVSASTTQPPTQPPTQPIQTTQLPQTTTQTPPPTTGVACVGSPPVSDAVCAEGSWKLQSSLANQGTVVVGVTPLVIVGNLTQGVGAVLQIVLATDAFTGPPVTVAGSLVNNGTIEIVLANAPQPGIYPIITLGGQVTGTGSIIVTQTYSGCKRKVGTQRSDDGLSILLGVTDGDCGGANKKGIIIGAVLGGAFVLLVVVAVVLIFVLRPAFFFKRPVTRAQRQLY